MRSTLITMLLATACCSLSFAQDTASRPIIDSEEGVPWDSYRLAVLGLPVLQFDFESSQRQIFQAQKIRTCTVSSKGKDSTWTSYRGEFDRNGNPIITEDRNFRTPFFNTNGKGHYQYNDSGHTTRFWSIIDPAVKDTLRTDYSYTNKGYYAGQTVYYRPEKGNKGYSKVREISYAWKPGEFIERNEDYETRSASYIRKINLKWDTLGRLYSVHKYRNDQLKEWHHYYYEADTVTQLVHLDMNGYGPYTRKITLNKQGQPARLVVAGLDGVERERITWHYNANSTIARIDYPTVQQIFTYTTY